MQQSFVTHRQVQATSWGDEALSKCFSADLDSFRSLALILRRHLFCASIRGKHWVVLEPLVYLMPKADPKQTAKAHLLLVRVRIRLVAGEDKLGQKGQGEILEGDGLRIEGR